MSVIAWPTVLTALQDLFQAGSGLADTRVLFQRNGHRVTRPNGTAAWISLKFESSNTIGRPYTQEVALEGSPPSGAEIEEHTVSQTRVMFTATAYPPENADDATEGYALLNDVIIEAFTPPRAKALRTAGIGLLKFETVTRLDGTGMGTRFEPRAYVTFAFTVKAEKITTNGYIDTVNAELRDKDSDALIYSFTVEDVSE